MNNIAILQNKITTLVENSYRDPKSFETFSNDLLNLGIIRFNFDAIKDEMSFYTNTQFVHSLIRTDLKEAQQKNVWILGETLDINALEADIKALDDGKISTAEFHQKMFSAGVIFCNVYLTLRKIYYMGQDARFYLENY